MRFKLTINTLLRSFHNSVSLEFTSHSQLFPKEKKAKKFFKMKLFIFAVICVLHVANATPTPTPTARPTPPGTPTEHPEHRDLPRLDITDENTDVIGSFDLGYDLIMGKVVTREPAEKTIEETVTFPWVWHTLMQLKETKVLFFFL